MSKNKFWNKDKQVTPITEEADLENTTTESLNTKVELNEVSVTIEKLPSPFELGQYNGIDIVLDILYNYKRNMMDDTYSQDLKLTADWLKIILKRKGFDL